jgi:hypothetical protein
MHRYIQARLKSDFIQEFSQDLAKPLDQPQNGAPFVEPQNRPALQLNFAFAMPGATSGS